MVNVVAQNQLPITYVEQSDIDNIVSLHVCMSVLIGFQGQSNG